MRPWCLVQVCIYIYIYYIVNPPLQSGPERRTNHASSTRKHRTGRALRSKSLLGCAPQPLAARNRCSGVPRSHLALEITARARLFVFGNTRKRRPSVSARSRGSNKRRWIRQHFRVSCGVPFEFRNPFRNRSALKSALLRAVLCATPQAPSGAICGSSIYIYIHVYIKMCIE